MIKITLYSLLMLLPLLSHAAIINLSSGDSINAQIIDNTDSYIKVEHSVLGTLTIQRTQIISLNDKEFTPINHESTIVSASEVEVNQEEPIDKGMFGRGWVFPGFDRKFALGISGKESNSTNIDIYTAFDANYENDYKRWNVGFRSNYSDEDRENTDNDFRFYVNRVWLNPDSRWLYFTKLQYDWDDFKSWDHRLTAIGGPGYRFIKNERLELIGLTGLSLKKQYGSENDDIETELMVGFNSKWQLARLQAVEFETEFFTPYENFGEIRNLSQLDWIYKLTSDSRQINLKVSLDYEYDWNVDPGDKNEEFIYRTSLEWDL
jgi:uncharacterized protein DUF481